MRHIVTLSLVFFSLTHLAKAERIETYRLLTKQYCDRHQVTNEGLSINSSQPDDPRYPFFLSSSDLTSIGLTSEIYLEKLRIRNNTIVNLTIKETPKNNSP